MKNKWIIFLLNIVALTACKGFLDEMDQDLFIPTTVEHYSSLLLNEFNNSGIPFTTIQCMTDEVNEKNGDVSYSGSRDNIKPLYTWQRNIELTEDGNIVNRYETWQNFYRCIAITNYILEEIDNASDEAEEIQYMKGEAYFTRAYCYFVLLNLYAEPYIDEEQSKVTQGIPLKTNIGVETVFDRNSLWECYQLIENDLNLAIKLFENNHIEKSIFHPSLYSSYLLLSRVKLYKKEYDNVIELATKVVDKYPLNALFDTDNLPIINKTNSEIIFSFFPGRGSLSASTMKSYSISVSEELLSLYDEEDLRKKLYFVVEIDIDGNINTYNKKANGSYTELAISNFRSSEAILNRSEAFINLNQTESAKKDIEELLKKRYLHGSGYQIPSSQEELTTFIQNERFKELCFEEYHRWFDLRRMNEHHRPEIIHLFTNVDMYNNQLNTQSYTLLKNDKNFTLSLPIEEKNNNLYIRDYDRFDKMEDYK